MTRPRSARIRFASAARGGWDSVPRWVVVPAVVGAALVLVPLAGLAIGAGWPRFASEVTAPSSLTALALSLGTASLATLVCLVLGVPLAVVLARGDFPGRRALRAVVLVPLVLPPVVGGLALLAAFGRRGVLGPVLAPLGVEVAFTTTAVVLAQVFVSLPFLVLTLEGALAVHGERWERVAATLGASRARTFLRVTLPLVAPGIASGTVLAFARSLGEFGATLTFAGSLEGTTRTLPLEIYLQRETDPPAALALSLVLVAVALVVVVLTRRRAGVTGAVAARRTRSERVAASREAAEITARADRAPS